MTLFLHTARHPSNEFQSDTIGTKTSLICASKPQHREFVDCRQRVCHICKLSSFIVIKDVQVPKMCTESGKRFVYHISVYSQVHLKISFLVLYKKYLQTNDLEKKSYGERSLFDDDYAYLGSIICSNTEVNASRSYHQVVLAVCKCRRLECKQTYMYIQLI